MAVMRSMGSDVRHPAPSVRVKPSSCFRPPPPHRRSGCPRILVIAPLRLRSAAVRIATWNVNSLKARLSRVEEWLGYARPDVLCLQETKLADSAFPAMAFAALGY